MDSRRVILFIVLSIAVMAIWQYLFPPPRVTRQPAVATTAAPAVSGSAAVQPGAEPPSAPGGPGAGGTAAGRTAAAPAAGAAASGPPIAAEREQQVVLASGGQTHAVFTNRGAQLLSLEVEQPGTGSVELVRKRVQDPYPFALIDRSLRPLPVDEALFAVERGEDGRSVTFRYRGPAGSAEKTFRFDERGLLAVEVEAAGSWALLLGPGIGNPTATELDSRYGLRGAVVKAGGDVKVLSPKSDNEVVTYPGAALAWAGLEDTYFAAIAVPRNGTLARAVLQPMLVEPQAAGARFAPAPSKDAMTSEQKDLSREFALALEPAAGRLSLECYLGAKGYERLKALPYGLEETVSLGWLSPVVRPLLAGLHWLYDHVVPNYGWAIILMTVAIKVLLVPLTHHSTMSMRKMQVLNPRMQAIRERFRPKLKDKQGRPNLEMQRKMNEEVMALYKSEGVNPAGGCLPLLVQMPILYAFYRLLSTSVELRHAPWIFWIHDLSAADPHLILPLIMGATQFLQVKFAPQSGDPAQRRLFLLMPLFMLIFFLSAPSGLVLYWLTNNVLTIVQQAVYNRFWKLEGAQ
ncbi:MAG TPA: membrane protein insertase YidC [Thermoanaerobaculia bacterium]|nr:membrane protein insertase YidC [Thermoanaerobaculia bacterium]